MLNIVIAYDNSLIFSFAKDYIHIFAAHKECA
jgi:hypothetical protein